MSRCIRQSIYRVTQCQCIQVWSRTVDRHEAVVRHQTDLRKGMTSQDMVEGRADHTPFVSLGVDCVLCRNDPEALAATRSSKTSPSPTPEHRSCSTQSIVLGRSDREFDRCALPR